VGMEVDHRRGINRELNSFGNGQPITPSEWESSA